MNTALLRSLLGMALCASISCAEADPMSDVVGAEVERDELGELSAALGPDIAIGDRAVMIQNLNDPTVPSTRRQFNYGQTGKCLDVIGYGTHGAGLQIWTCNGTDNQRFSVEGRRVRVAHSHLCLEAGTNGVDLYTATCDDNNARQHWNWSTSSVLGVNIGGQGRCLDIQGGAAHNGARVQLWNCHGDGNQVWRPQATILRGRASGRCLDVIDYGGSDRVHLWECSYQPHQLWRVTRSGRLVSENDGRCLQPIGNNWTSSANLELVDCATPFYGIDWQYAPDGTLSKSSLCLDASGNHDGANVTIHSCHGGSNQSWHTR